MKKQFQIFGVPIIRRWNINVYVLNINLLIDSREELRENISTFFHSFFYSVPFRFRNSFGDVLDSGEEFSHGNFSWLLKTQNCTEVKFLINFINMMKLKLKIEVDDQRKSFFFEIVQNFKMQNAYQNFASWIFAFIMFSKCHQILKLMKIVGTFSTFYLNLKYLPLIHKEFIPEFQRVQLSISSFHFYLKYWTSSIKIKLTFRNFNDFQTIWICFKYRRIVSSGSL